MGKKTKSAFVATGLTVIILVLMLVIPHDTSENLVVSALHAMSSSIYDSKQYEPAVAFKEKYPDYIIMKKSDYPRGDKYARIVYAYTNSSLYRTEILSVQGDYYNPSFSRKCIDENGQNFGTLSAKSPYFSKSDVDDFKCANYEMDSYTLQKMHDTKRILERSEFPIKKIGYDYDNGSLKIILFEFPQDNYEEKIKKILFENGVDASIEYQLFVIVRL